METKCGGRYQDPSLGELLLADRYNAVDVGISCDLSSRRN